MDGKDSPEENVEDIKKHLEAMLRECKGLEGLRYLSPPVGILRRGSGGRKFPADASGNREKEQLSPQPSVDRVSVTFAEDSIKSDFSSKGRLHYRHKSAMDKQQGSNATDEEETEDEDYSASVNAIMQRRASVRKSRRRNSRRASSPFNPDMLPGPENVIRRRSSVYTSSSGETAITVEDSIAQEMTQEQIFENIKLHKEVLSNVKMQPWNMRRKLKLVIQAKNYVKRHEGALQERFTQSRSIKDMLARWNIYLATKWQRYKREMANLSNFLIPWELTIKEIESHFGSAVASYFIFLRWLFWVNLVTAAVLLAFVAIPEMLTANWNDSLRKKVLPEEKYNSTNFLTLWDFEGVLKYTPLFYGWYTREEDHKTGYRLPLAYFMTQLVVYVYSFIAILRKMAENSRMSKLSEKEDECVFTWKVFTGWDYMIGNAETAHNRVSSIVMGFKEALLEEAEKKRDSRNWRIISSRVFVNLMVISLLILSAWVVIKVVNRSTEPESMSTVWRRNEITVVLNLISTSFPIGFEVLGIIEKYHPRKALRIHLARIMVLNLLNVYSLIFAQFVKIDGMTKRLNEMNDSISKGYNPPFYKINFGQTECLCDGMKAVTLSTTPIFLNVTTTAIPQLYNFTSDSYSETFDQTLNTTDGDDFDTTTYEDKDFLSDNSTFTTELTTTIMSINESTDTVSFNESSFNISATAFYNTSDNVSASPEWTRSYNKSGIFDGIDLDYYSNEVDSENSIDDPLMDELKDFNVLNITMSTYEEETNASSSSLEQNFTEFVQNNDTEYSTNPNEITSNFYQTETTTNRDISSQSEYEDISSDMPTTFETSNSFSEYYKKADNNLFRSITKAWNETIDESQQTTTEDTPTCETICRNWALNKTASNDTTKLSILEEKADKLPYQNRSELRTLCWETMFGQELVKIVIMDLIMTALGILAIDFFRGLFLRVMNRCWCWDLEKKFPEYGEFKVAENILHLVNNQGMVWMGMFFSPGLAWINVIKLYILMYLRSWTVLTCNVPHSVVFRASRSNNFYFTLLLTMLFLCTLPVGYAVVWVEPSWHCGPFSNYHRIFHIFTTTIKSIVPQNLHKVLDYIASPGIIIPLLVLLILIIYYLVSLTGALREANNDLKIQLRQERTEERRKMFKLVDRRRRIGSGGSGEFDNTPFARWKKLLNNLPSQKSLEEVVKEPEMDALGQEQKDSNKTKEILAKFIRKALRRASTSEEENLPLPDDATDNEQHESLPDDTKPPKQDVQGKEIRSPKSPRTKANAVFQNFQNTVHLALTRKRSNSENNESCENPPANVTSPALKHKDTSSSSINLHEESLSKKNGSKKHLKGNRHPKWTDNIPLITISKTESDDSLLKSSTTDVKAKSEESPQNKEEKPKSFDNNVPSGSKTIPENTSKETHRKSKDKHLKKQSTVENNEDNTSEGEKRKSSLSI